MITTREVLLYGLAVLAGTTANTRAQAPFPIDADLPQSGGPHFAYGAVPPGTTPSTQTLTSTPAQSNLPLNAVSTISHATHGRLWDVDVRVNVQHADGAELDLFLIAPDGRRVTLSTDNAAGVANAFTNTTFDDSSDVTVREQTFTSGGVFTVTPEGALGSLLDLDPFGDWELHASDDTGATTGVLVSWSLVLTTLTPDPAPIDYTTYDYQPFTVNIPDNNAIGRYGFALVIDAGVQLKSARLGLNLNHPRPSDLVITLTSPAGTQITLARHSGGSTANFFGNVVFRDDATFAGLDATVSDFSGVPAQVTPEGAMSRFAGEFAEGGWSVHVQDLVPGMTGQLLGVWIETDVWDVGGSSNGFCPSGISSEGCIPLFTASGANLVTIGAPGNRTGLYFFGVNGPRFTPWAPGSTSWLCARGPLRRSSAMTSGGQFGQCDGSYTHNIAGALSAAGVPSGTTVHLQCWYRDPPAPKQTSLTNAQVITAP